MINIAIFASGSGSNFEAIVRSYLDGNLKVRPVLCICDRPGAFVMERASKLGIPAFAFSPKDFENKAAYETAVAKKLKEYDVSLICLAGYMRLVGPTLLNLFPRKILNIHPSLLPAFKGAHAIRDAFDYGVKVFGVTIHYVDESLDGGEIVSQEAFHYDGRDIDLLEKRIHEVEHRLYPLTINTIAQKF